MLYPSISVCQGHGQGHIFYCPMRWPGSSASTVYLRKDSSAEITKCQYGQVCGAVAVLVSVVVEVAVVVAECWFILLITVLWF